ncbi:MAG: ACT domain-containing protein [Clostridia bacterium]|nr:ACT domain-containing protein [Clostridia bacterium]
MVLELSDIDFSICKLTSFENVDCTVPFSFFCLSDKEHSLICPEYALPKNTMCSDNGWKMFRLGGQFEFSLTGILAGVADILRDSNVPVMATSTFDTDYFFVKKEFFARAIDALAAAGYQIASLIVNARA